MHSIERTAPQGATRSSYTSRTMMATLGHHPLPYLSREPQGPKTLVDLNRCRGVRRGAAPSKSAHGTKDDQHSAGSSIAF
jgi:hypothetical protein